MSVPIYAQKVPLTKRVKFFCKGRCSSGRFGELNMTKGDADKLLKKVQADSNEEYFPKIKVTCAKCGQTQSDYYNWASEFRI